MRRLNGRAKVHGAKNSALPVLAASIIAADRCIIRNCPDLSDVHSCLNILRSLGCTARLEEDIAVIDTSGMTGCDIPESLMRRMRSSICFLGALLARTGSVTLCLPGGCELGPRPIDIHLASLERMGADITERAGCISCTAHNGLHGGVVPLSFPSVGATENVMIAACTAKGTTVITNAAREPEICCLADFLNACGARISGAGQSTVTVEGVQHLHGCVHTVIPDRIEAATWLCAGAITHGDIAVSGADVSHLMPVLPVLEEMGCTIRAGNELRLIAPERLRRVSVRTMPYPGFPTDCQAIVMAAAGVASGTSFFVENIFDSRFKHVGELRRLGAHIRTEGRAALVEGIKEYSGAQVDSTDLRGAAALMTAALWAEGETIVRGLEHLDRGYQSPETELAQLGADIIREDE